MRILAQLIPTREKEQKRVKPYTSLEIKESWYSREDRSIGLSKMVQSM